MSGISRLLRWAPCLYAVSRLVSNSGQAPRTHLVNASSSTTSASGPNDLLHTLSFPAKTVVKHSHIPRPAPAPHRRRDFSPARDEGCLASGTVGDAAMTLMRRVMRSRSPLVQDGWQWDNPFRLPVRAAFKAASISSKIVSQVRGVSFASNLPIELHEAILITARHPVRHSGTFNQGDLLLVSRHWNQLHRAHIWQRRWLNLRPANASWSSIGERIQALVRNADVIKNVKIEGWLTDITPTSLERALVECPELAQIARCRVERIKVGRLDSVTEILLKQLLLHRQEAIRHFGFQIGDALLFLGRRSIFSESVIELPNIRRITVDISSIEEARFLEDLHGSSAGVVSFLIAELVGRNNKETARQVEVRLYCQPECEDGQRRSKVTGEHVILAGKIFGFTRAILDHVRGLNLVVSFQAPIRSQQAHKRHMLAFWAREITISLINT